MFLPRYKLKMAADFDQVRITDLDLPDIKVEITMEGEKTDKGEANIQCHPPGPGHSVYCGESVKPGVGPGVLIGKTVPWKFSHHFKFSMFRHRSCLEKRKGNDHRCG